MKNSFEYTLTIIILCSYVNKQIDDSDHKLEQNQYKAVRKM